MFEYLIEIEPRLYDRFLTVERDVKAASNSFYDAYLDLQEQFIKTVAVSCGFDIMPTLLVLSAVQEFPFPWYELTGLDYLILFGIVVLTSIISSVLPLIKLSKKTSRELMVK